MGSLHMLMPRYVEKVQKNMTSGCVAYDTYYEPPYQYDPSLVAGIIFCVCFFVGTAAHLWTTISKRKWFYLSFVLGAVGMYSHSFCPLVKYNLLIIRSNR